MDDGALYKSDETQAEASKQMFRQNTEDIAHSGAGAIEKEKSKKSIGGIMKKIIGVLLVIWLGSLSMGSVSTAFVFIRATFQEGVSSPVVSILVTILVCLAIVAIFLATKRYKQLLQTVEPKLNRRLLIYSIISSISSAMSLIMIIITINMMIPLMSCEGSSCAAGIAVAFAFYPIIFFTTLSIVFIVLMIKLNKRVAPKMPC